GRQEVGRRHSEPRGDPGDGCDKSALEGHLALCYHGAADLHLPCCGHLQTFLDGLRATQGGGRGQGGGGRGGGASPPRPTPGGRPQGSGPGVGSSALLGGDAHRSGQPGFWSNLRGGSTYSGLHRLRSLLCCAFRLHNPGHARLFEQGPPQKHSVSRFHARPCGAGALRHGLGCALQTSAACSDEITSLWLQSWHDAPGGGLMVPILSKLGFSGVALFITNAYLPQLLVVYTFVAPFVALVFVLLVMLWASFGWLVGLAAMLCVYALVICSPIGTFQMSLFHEQVDSENLRLALYSGAEVVELPADGPQNAEGRVAFILGTKLLLENLLQLWLQSSYLSLSFDRMDTFARWQAMASIGVGLLVAGGKGLQISAVVVPKLAWCARAVRQCDIPAIIMGAVPVFMMLAGFGGLAWVAAKVVFIFQCDSHVWNLSTGCVSPQT
ncbi:unnamed protein product, partial [Symbiodinium necroappetens]